MNLVDNNSSFGLYDPDTDAEFNVRRLYDFFDEHEISCFIMPGSSEAEKIPYIQHYYKGPYHYSRNEAEDDLFTQAFHLLNARLRTINPRTRQV